MRSVRSKLLLIGGICILLLLAIAVCAGIGSADLSAGKILRYCFTGEGLSDLEQGIFVNVRLSRILLAALAGFALSIAGTVFQALLRNPLADPFIIGISSGSALGAILVISLGITAFGFNSVPLFAFLGGFISLLVVYRLSRVGNNLHAHTLLLTGVVINAFFSAIIMFIISISEANRLHGIMFWLMGNLSYTEFSRLGIIGVYILVSSLLIYAFAKDIDIMTLGDEAAQQLGVEVEKVKKILFFATALLVGAIVSITGLIGFVGLIVPHIVRLIIGPKHRYLLPAAGLSGALFLVVSDTIARTVLSPVEIPVGVVTAFLGAPFFIYLLRIKGRR